MQGNQTKGKGRAMDLISRQMAIDTIDSFCAFWSRQDQIALECKIRELPPAQPQIIYCKDCKKHNKRIGDYEELPVGGKWIWKENACPLIEFRGKAQGHEFDYQFCAYAERRTE